MNIGFIGLGNMGAGMASNLQIFCAAQGFILTVLDLDKTKVQQLVDMGATAGTSIAQVTSQADVLFTSLPSSKEVNLVAYGDQGILKHLKLGAIWVETSTNELAEWNNVLASAPQHASLVDGPVTGGAEGAAAGTLTMLLGIEQALLDAPVGDAQGQSQPKLSDILAAFTSKACRMGPSGAGYVTKLSQLHLNYLVAQGIGEALMLGAKADLDLTALHQVLQTSCAQSYVVDSYIPKVLDGSYDPSFSLGLATKDMRLITELGAHLGVGLPLGDKVYQTYQTATQTYGFDEPHLSVVKLVEAQAEKQLR